MKQITVKFPNKGITTIHIPFFANVGSYEQLYKQIASIQYPKFVKSVEASLTVRIDLREGKTSYEMAEVRLNRNH